MALDVLDGHDVRPYNEVARARVAEELARHAVVEVADSALAHGDEVADEDACAND